MTDRPADQAKRGLLTSVTGKAKEVAGAVLGNDSLASEGQLQQAEAAARSVESSWAATQRAVIDVVTDECAGLLGS